MDKNIMTQHGFTISLVAVISLAASLLILWIMKVTQSSSLEGTYLRTMEKVYSIGETGLNRAVSKLIFDPNAYLQSTFSDPDTSFGPGQVFENHCEKRDLPVENCYYLVTSATVSVKGKIYSQKLHSYFTVSNVGDYFAAINDTVYISQGTDITDGKVYGKKLVFGDSPSMPQTKVEKAEFLKHITLPCNSDPGCTPRLDASCEWSAAIKLRIDLAEPANKSPVPLSSPPLFPQITTNDMERYEALARLTGNHTVTGNFSGDIYPPGFYEFNPLTHPVTDTYTGHTNDNREHVYFFNGDMHISGTVHGQVLFVATGKIIIDGNLRVSTDPPPFPGADHVSSSTAHQAILIPGPNKNVEINNTFHSGGPSCETQYIEALILAPAGNIVPLLYTPATTHDKLKLEFTGSMILGRSPSFAEVYNCQTPPARTYKYMTTLKTNPPPYLPAITVIYNEFQEITSEHGAFN